VSSEKPMSAATLANVRRVSCERASAGGVEEPGDLSPQESGAGSKSAGENPVSSTARQAFEKAPHWFADWTNTSPRLALFKPQDARGWSISAQRRPAPSP
jgi:hypothetical protein